MLKIFISYFIKGIATMLLCMGTIVNLLNNGIAGVAASLMNLIILVAVWSPSYLNKESE